MLRDEAAAGSGEPPRGRTARLSQAAVTPAPPRLFQLQEKKRSLSLPVCWALVVHVGLLVWLAALELTPRQATPKPVAIVFKKPRPPPPKPIELPGGGGGPVRPAKRRIKPPPPPPVEDPLPLPKILQPPVEPPEEAESDESEADGETATGAGSGSGGGVGTGTGTGVGPGHGAGVPSKERKAWLVHTDWKCTRPGQEDLGRVVVRIRVQVLPSGKPGEITVVHSGPEAFNQRAIACARAENYLPALDREGHPIPSEVVFGIDFLL
jgi:Gram-negative bacterial TonB protein C-terminal